MKRKSISILKFMVVVGGAVISLAGTINAQSENQRSDTDIADNPHLRSAKSSSTSSSSSTKTSDKDKSFVAEASGGGSQEVEDGKVAESRGQSAQVKKIGARMVADHSKANKELTALAKSKGLGVSMAKARQFSGADFDSRYLATAEADHKKDIKLFEKEASSGDDKEIKGFAAKTLPTLKEHLAMIEQARKKK
jgi:putative membrane protein